MTEIRHIKTETHNIEKQVDRELTQGKEHLAASMKLAEEVLSSSSAKPDKEQRLLMKYSASYLYQEQKFGDAEKICEAGLKACPNEAKPTWLHDLSIMEASQGKYKEAYDHVLQMKNIHQSKYDKSNDSESLFALQNDYSHLSKLSEKLNSPILAKEYDNKSEKYSKAWAEGLRKAMQAVEDYVRQHPNEKQKILRLLRF